mmetsp:Transcript_17132/g.52059  ORF Transcript_17132/g.52059 Transcript_17132/m.52059 type:complete len:408 (+) Transcript_17132:540-1763(+)
MSVPTSWEKVASSYRASISGGRGREKTSSCKQHVPGECIIRGRGREETSSCKQHAPASSGGVSRGAGNSGEVAFVHEFGPGEDGGEEEDEAAEGLGRGEAVVEAVLLGDDDGGRGTGRGGEEDRGAAVLAVEVGLGQEVHEARGDGDLEDEEEDRSQAAGAVADGLGRARDGEARRLLRLLVVFGRSGGHWQSAFLFGGGGGVVLDVVECGDGVLDVAVDAVLRRPRGLHGGTGGDDVGVVEVGVGGDVGAGEREGDGGRAGAEELGALVDEAPVGVLLDIVAAVRSRHRAADADGPGHGVLEEARDDDEAEARDVAPRRDERLVAGLDAELEHDDLPRQLEDEGRNRRAQRHADGVPRAGRPQQRDADQHRRHPRQRQPGLDRAQQEQPPVPRPLHDGRLQHRQPE